MSTILSGIVGYCEIYSTLLRQSIVNIFALFLLFSFTNKRNMLQKKKERKN